MRALIASLLLCACATAPRPPPTEASRPDVSREVIYGVIPSLFGERGLPDVTARLDELADLGVTTLWLGPIWDAQEGDYGYAVEDYFTVRPELGGEAALKNLFEQAHARGLKVILDYVPNHTADTHPAFVAAQDPASDKRGWYEWGEGGERTHYFDWKNLPNLEHEHPAVEAMLIDAARKWVRLGADGFRVDAAWGPRERNPEFFSRWVKALRAEKPDLLLLAEASAKDPYFADVGFDLSYDWTDEIGKWAWQPAWDAKDREGAVLEAALGSFDPRTARFLANNDTGRRFHDQHGRTILDAAFTLLLTAPGVPVLFTGDEVAASYEPYAEPPPLAWDDPHRVRPRVKELVALRKTLPALTGPETEPLDTGPDPELLGYVREGGGQRAYVVMSFAEAPRQVTLPVSTRDARTGEEFTAGESVPLAPGQGRILAPLAR